MAIKTKKEEPKGKHEEYSPLPGQEKGWYAEGASPQGKGAKREYSPLPNIVPKKQPASEYKELPADAGEVGVLPERKRTRRTAPVEQE